MIELVITSDRASDRTSDTTSDRTSNKVTTVIVILALTCFEMLALNKKFIVYQIFLADLSSKMIP